MERRKFKRIRATASVGYSVAGAARPALTYDLSTHGCMIQSEPGLLETGEELELNFGEGLFVKGRVVWVRQRNAGIQFEAPLSVLAAKKILFNVVGTGLQHALQGTSARVVARHIQPLLRWWPERMVRFSRPKVHLDCDGTVRYSQNIEALILASWLAPFFFTAPVIFRK
jgi:hypothetical protein